MAQTLCNFGNVVLLEEADGGDAGGPGCQAGVGIIQSNSTQRQDWDVRLAGFVEKVETRGAGVFFFEYRGEDGEGCGAGGGLGYFCRGVAGDCDQGISW